MVRLRSTSGRAARTALATLLLVSFLASSFEAVAGLARDGSVHHEKTTEALAHVSGGTGEHGHEAASEAPTEDHGPDHQHGTGADHCTHAHSAAVLMQAPAATVIPDASMRSLPVSSTLADHREPPLLHPPRI